MPDTADPKNIEPAAVAPEAVAERASSPLKTRLKLLAFGVLVVFAECLMAYFCIPTPQDAAAMAVPSHGMTPAVASPFDLDEESQEVQEEMAEIDLGEFTVTSYQPVSATTLRIDFHLFGTVAAKDKEDVDLAIQNNLHRIRDQVIVIVRSAEVDDVTDAGLGLIKRKILEKTNHSLGKPFLQAVIFSDFSFIEQ